jgi:hypothetical protein
LRRGFEGNLFLSDGGTFLGVNLGADYCAEHEWGLEGLARDFGILASASPGLPRHVIRKLPNLAWAKFEHLPKKAFVGYTNSEGKISRELSNMRENELVMGAWSGSDFGVVFRERRYAQELWDAFQRLDVAFLFLKNENPFGRSGLCLMISSLLDPEIVKRMSEEEAEHDRLLEVVKATGIEERLKKAGDAAAPKGYIFPKPFSYFALSPRWADEEHTKIKFWLNPCDQKNNNAAWVTVEDLDDWIAGKGKIPKNPR